MTKLGFVLLLASVGSSSPVVARPIASLALGLCLGYAADKLYRLTFGNAHVATAHYGIIHVTPSSFPSCNALPSIHIHGFQPDFIPILTRDVELAMTMLQNAHDALIASPTGTLSYHRYFSPKHTTHVLKKLAHLLQITLVSIRNVTILQDEHTFAYCHTPPPFLSQITRLKPALYLNTALPVFANDWSSENRATILIHEWTHHVFRTDDYGYGEDECTQLPPEKQFKNADSYSLYVRDEYASKWRLKVQRCHEWNVTIKRPPMQNDEMVKWKKTISKDKTFRILIIKQL